MADALAAVDDVKAALGRDLTTSEANRVPDILLKASELFRRAAGQTFTAGTSDVRLLVVGGDVYLPERPVTSVASVVDDNGAAVTYTRRGQIITTSLGSGRFVVVVYSHGGTVPDLVRTTVADITRKVLTIPEQAATGIARTTETKGPFSTTVEYATWAQGGQTMLAPDDYMIARSYRVRRPRVFVPPAPVAAGDAVFGTQLPGYP